MGEGLMGKYRKSIAALAGFLATALSALTLTGAWQTVVTAILPGLTWVAVHLTPNEQTLLI